MNIRLPARLGFALVSGLVVGLMQESWGIFAVVSDEPTVYFASGFVFAVGVLFPWLKAGKQTWLRALAFVAVSVLSYYTAVWVALEGLFGDGITAFTAASVVGAAIVVAPFPWLAPARASRMLYVAVLIAALIGGPITLLTLPEDGLARVVAGHMSWHALIGVALYLGVEVLGTGRRTVVGPGAVLS